MSNDRCLVVTNGEGYGAIALELGLIDEATGEITIKGKGSLALFNATNGPLREIGRGKEGLLTIKDGKGYDDIVLEPGLIAEATPGKLYIKNKPA